MDPFPHLKYFHPYQDIRKTRSSLPHWQQPGATVFVTFRTADSLPQTVHEDLLLQRDAWLAQHPPPHSDAEEAEYHDLFTKRLDHWLDQGHGACVLRHETAREAVAKAFSFFQGERYDQQAWVIMPNHVHLLFTLHPNWRLEQVLHTWKRHTARVINQSLGRSGIFWQHDYHDRLIRSPEHFRYVARYIRRNPQLLSANEYTLWESEAVAAIL